MGELADLLAKAKDKIVRSEAMHKAADVTHGGVKRAEGILGEVNESDLLINAQNMLKAADKAYESFKKFYGKEKEETEE
jgi:hypothetical protein